MRGFHQAGEFTRRNQRDITRAAAADDYYFLVVHDPVEYGSQFLAQFRVRCFYGHDNLASVYRIPVRLDNCRNAQI